MEQKNYLTLHQVGLLKKSYRQLEPMMVARRFYDKLFDLCPHLKPLFPPDQSEQMIKLMSVLELVVFSFEEKSNNKFGLQDSMILPLRDLGRKHDDKGIKPSHYDVANNLLIEAIQEHLNGEFTIEIKESWLSALTILSTAMQDASVDTVKRTGESFNATFRQIFNDLKKRMSLSN